MGCSTGQEGFRWVGGVGPHGILGCCNAYVEVACDRALDEPNEVPVTKADVETKSLTEDRKCLVFICWVVRSQCDQFLSREFENIAKTVHNL